jgi:predicted metal-dependent hydrolase
MGNNAAKGFTLAAIPITVEYKQVKIMRLTVFPPDGRVCIAVPPGTSEESIRRFAASKLQWIEKHRRRFPQNEINDGGDGACSNTQGRLRNNAVHFVWGAACKLELIEQSGRPKITMEGAAIRLQSQPGTAKSKRQQMLDKWYRRLMEESAPVLIKKWEPVIGVSIGAVFYRKMKTRWGSCNYRRRTIRLNTELAKKSPACLEYVIVHEMLHVIESGHNRNFYRLLSRYVPNWKMIRKKMNNGEM